ncbi:Asp-tRNA(Asn)/Glu-tRNA(Gln) amidotransferase subunit GatB [symbiont of Argiope bruennichi]|uniref:Asp-tRNA(Asn)/Glu-tRNA(Gln) amidotransferase subunit GatB n=1 Tax=symbiont of Argiope bruennichi TaxID=2810479 RepID=UPI003DA48A2D
MKNNLIDQFDVNIGTEVHCSVKIDRKMFSLTKIVEDAEEPNKHISFWELGYPGIKPIINFEVVKKAIFLAYALNMNVSNILVFDRKNYFYYDLPKGYQITQNFYPIAKNGFLEIVLPDKKVKKIKILKIQIEEDTAKSIHKDGEILLDFSRSGNPLLEIVSDCNITDENELIIFLRLLRVTLKFLKISDCKMEKAQLRCDINVSLSKKNSKTLGQKVEIKNLNSFFNIQKAISFEIEEQLNLLSQNKNVVQVTKNFDEKTKSLIFSRMKESNVGYRFFRESNLLPYKLMSNELEEIENEILRLELPSKKLQKFTLNYNLSVNEALFILENEDVLNFFENLSKETFFYKRAYQIIFDIVLPNLRKLNLNFSNFLCTSIIFGKIVNLCEKDHNKFSLVKKLIIESIEKNYEITIKNIKEIENISFASDEEMFLTIKNIFDKKPDLVSSYLKKPEKIIKFLIGELNRKFKGKINNKDLNKKLEEFIQTKIIKNN